MIAAGIVILIVMLFMSGVTIASFSWAANNKQFNDLKDAGECIFSPDEPIGEATDPALRERQLKVELRNE